MLDTPIYRHMTCRLYLYYFTAHRQGFCLSLKYSSTLGIASITTSSSYDFMRMQLFNSLALVSFSFSQSSLKPLESKSAISRFPLNKNISAVFLLLSTFPSSRCTSSTAHSCFSSCGLYQHSIISEVQLSLSHILYYLCNSSRNHLQPKLKSSSISDRNRCIRLQHRLSLCESRSASSSASTHPPSSSRRRGKC